MEQFVGALNNIIWSSWLVWLCLGAGIFFSVAMKFPQVRLWGEMIRLLFDGEASENGVSSFQSFAMALGGRVGTGNIAGVASAIGFGGPGAVVWMWIIAFLGAGSAYTEAALAQVYKDEMDGQYRGGPAYYFEKGLGQKWYGVLFAISAIVGVGFFLPGIQSNAIAVSINYAFGVPKIVTGAIVAIVLGIVIFGGVKRIGKTAEIIVPFMAIAYIIMALVIIAMNAGEIIPTFKLMFTSAFSPKSAFGGVLGSTIMWGVKRGIYSNEAGQGTGPMAAGAAEVAHPAQQGLVQAFSVYVDTLFVCTATALMIIITGSYNVYGPSGEVLVKNIGDVQPGPEFTQMAIDTVIPGFGSGFVAIALLFFSFSTLLAYYYYTETSVAYLARSMKNHKLVFNVARITLVLMTFYGAINSAGAAWALGDAGVGIMAWLNIIGILLLSGVGIKTLKDYEEQKAAGGPITFDPEKLGIKNADFWVNKIKKDRKNA